MEVKIITSNITTKPPGLDLGVLLLQQPLLSPPYSELVPLSTLTNNLTYSSINLNQLLSLLLTKNYSFLNQKTKTKKIGASPMDGFIVHRNAAKPFHLLTKD